MAEIRALELLARNVRENDAEAVGHREVALVAVTGWRLEQRVSLKDVLDAMRVLSRLIERMRLLNETRAGQQTDACARDRLNVLELPVFDFEHEKTAARMKDDEVWMLMFAPDRHVEPAEIVVLEMHLEPLRKAPLPCCGS